MVAGAGSPVDRSPVPCANVSQFTDWLVAGYEAQAGSPVDRAALARMVAIRRQLYLRFCRTAVKQLDPATHEFMHNFCAYIVSNFERGAL